MILRPNQMRYPKIVNSEDIHKFSRYNYGHDELVKSIRAFEEEMDAAHLEMGSDWEVKPASVLVKPSEFAEWGLKVYFDKEYRNFRFDGRRYLKQIYDMDLRLILWKCSRQTEKSTFLGNRAITACSLHNGFRVIYVSPSNEQTKTFSRDKVDEIILQSPEIQPFLGSMGDQSLYLKKFKGTGSIYMLYYAFHNANRLRGKFGDELQIDEFQDIKPELLPVIEACLHHSTVRRQVRAGTPLSLDNPIEIEWQRSTQCEWIVPCSRCGGTGRTGPYSGYIHTGKYWQSLGEDNIAKKGLVCGRCGSRINPFHPDCHWERMNPNGGPWFGFHISQLQTPWIVNDENAWSDLYHDYQTMSQTQFRNERLGESDDSATRPITKDRLRELSAGGPAKRDLDKFRKLGRTQPIWMGIDWSPGDTENSYDVITMGTLLNGNFQIFFTQRCTGRYRDPKVLIPYIVQLVREFRVAGVGTDYGMGQDRNRELLKILGREKVYIYQYAKPNYTIKFSRDLGRFIVNKAEVFDALFMALRDGYFRLPAWEEFESPGAQDILNVFAEHKEGDTHNYRYSHNGTDDTWQSIVYTYLVSYISGNPSPQVLFPGGMSGSQSSSLGLI